MSVQTCYRLPVDWTPLGGEELGGLVRRGCMEKGEKGWIKRIDVVERGKGVIGGEKEGRDIGSSFNNKYHSLKGYAFINIY